MISSPSHVTVPTPSIPSLSSHSDKPTPTIQSPPRKKPKRSVKANVFFDNSHHIDSSISKRNKQYHCNQLKKTPSKLRIPTANTIPSPFTDFIDQILNYQKH